VQLLQCYLRAVELEMRASEEPLRPDLDVAGPKAQILERNEEVEREKGELLAGVTAMAEEHGPPVAVSSRAGARAEHPNSGPWRRARLRLSRRGVVAAWAG
jgi:hypothetical protein